MRDKNPYCLQMLSGMVSGSPYSFASCNACRTAARRFCWVSDSVKL